MIKNVKTLLCVGVCLFLSLSDALADSPDWMMGCIKLKNGTDKYGLVQPDLKREIVLFRESDRESMLVIPAASIISLTYFEGSAMRKFRAVSQRDGACGFSCLFEILLDGEIQILRRPSVETGEQQVAPYFNVYIHHADGVTPIQFFNRRVLPSLVKSNDALRAFIRQHQLKGNTLKNTIKIVRFYNESHDGSIARN